MVRGIESSKDKDRGKTSKPSTDIPWTCAKCTRLLRPLAAQLGALRKSKQPLHQGDGGARTSVKLASADSWPADSASSKYQRQGAAAETGNSSDSDWSAFLPNKRVKRKYKTRAPLDPALSSETSRSSHADSLPGEINILTPYLRRNLSRHDQRVCRQAASGGCDAENAPPGIKKRKKPHVSIAPTSHGLIRAFETIIKTTAGPGFAFDESRTLDRSLGPRSLFSTCLRNVPAHMEEERWLRKEENPDDDSNVAAETYAMLEDLESMAGVGWPHLREVVRAHGVSLAVTAIKESLINVETIDQLISVSTEHMAIAEAQEILSAFSSVQNPVPLPYAFDWKSNSHLTRLEAHSNIAQCRSFQFRQLAADILSGTLPLEWLVIQSCQTLWTEVILSISDEDCDFGDAVDLVETVLNTASDYSSARTDLSVDLLNEMPANDSTSDNRYIEPTVLEAFQNSVSSLCSILCSIAIFSHGEGAKPANCASINVMRPIRNTTVILRDKWATSTNASLGLPSLAALTVLVADLVLCLNNIALGAFTPKRLVQLHFELLDSFFTGPRLPEFTRILSNGIGVLSRLITSVARCCGRASSTDGFDVLKTTVNSLLTYRSDAVSRISRAQALFLARLAIESTIAFADITKNSEHFAFAQKVEGQVGGEHGAQQLPRSGDFDAALGEGSFRWEEGICEWVAATPAPNLTNSKRIRIVDTSPSNVGGAATADQRQRESTGDDGSDPLGYTDPARLVKSRGDAPRFLSPRSPHRSYFPVLIRQLRAPSSPDSPSSNDNLDIFSSPTSPSRMSLRDHQKLRAQLADFANEPIQKLEEYHGIAYRISQSSTSPDLVNKDRGAEALNGSVVEDGEDEDVVGESEDDEDELALQTPVRHATATDPSEPKDVSVARARLAESARSRRIAHRRAKAAAEYQLYGLMSDELG